MAPNLPLVPESIGEPSTENKHTDTQGLYTLMRHAHHRTHPLTLAQFSGEGLVQRTGQRAELGS